MSMSHSNRGLLVSSLLPGSPQVMTGVVMGGPPSSQGGMSHLAGGQGPEPTRYTTEVKALPLFVLVLSVPPPTSHQAIVTQDPRSQCHTLCSRCLCRVGL